MKRTLLEDLDKIYYLITCEDKDGSFCIDCDRCRNKLICYATIDLICSIKKFYSEAKK